MRRLALFDIDRTLYRGYRGEFSIFPLTSQQVRGGLLSRTARAELLSIMRRFKSERDRYRGKFRPELFGYEACIADLLASWAAGLRGEDYRSVVLGTEAYFQSARGRFYSYAWRVTDLLRPTHDIVIVTGEPQFIGETVGALMAATGVISSHFEVASEVLTGYVACYLATGKEKRHALNNVLRDVDLKGSFAFGDSEGDIEMLRAVEHPICVNPTDGLRREATVARWTVVRPSQVEAAVRAALGS